MQPSSLSTMTPTRLPAVVFGIGLGGLIDGVVLHEILQWHHMTSADVEPTTISAVEDNVLADGLFHLGALVLVVASAYMMLRAWQKRRPAPSVVSFSGLILLGWGLFNLVEGVINHEILQLHHVRDDLGGPIAWDIGFLVVAALQVVVGRWLYHRGLKRVGTSKQAHLLLPPLHPAESQESQH